MPQKYQIIINTPHTFEHLYLKLSTWGEIFYESFVLTKMILLVGFTEARLLCLFEDLGLDKTLLDNEKLDFILKTSDSYSFYISRKDTIDFLLYLYE